MIANLTRGAKSASIHLPAERRQIAGVLSYLGIDYLDEYALPSIGQNASGILASLEPTEDAEQCIVQICQNETVSLGWLNAGVHQLLSLPYLYAFNRLFCLTISVPFPPICSSVRVKRAEKWHFCDPALACALLKATPDTLIGDLLALLTESTWVAEFRSPAHAGKMNHEMDSAAGF